MSQSTKVVRPLTFMVQDIVRESSEINSTAPMEGVVRGLYSPVPQSIAPGGEMLAEALVPMMVLIKNRSPNHLDFDTGIYNIFLFFGVFLILIYYFL